MYQPTITCSLGKQKLNVSELNSLLKVEKNQFQHTIYSRPVAQTAGYSFICFTMPPGALIVSTLLLRSFLSLFYLFFYILKLLKRTIFIWFFNISQPTFEEMDSALIFTSHQMDLASFPFCFHYISSWFRNIFCLVKLCNLSVILSVAI